MASLRDLILHYFYMNVCKIEIDCFKIEAAYQVRRTDIIIAQSTMYTNPEWVTLNIHSFPCYLNQSQIAFTLNESFDQKIIWYLFLRSAQTIFPDQVPVYCTRTSLPLHLNLHQKNRITNKSRLNIAIEFS